MAFMPRISSGLNGRVHCRTSTTQYQKAMHSEANPAISTAYESSRAAC